MSTPAVWTLELNTILKTFATWQVKNPVLTYRSLDTDDLEFTVQNSTNGACPFVYADAVKLWRTAYPASPVCQFIGTVVSITAVGTPKNSEWRIKCSNVWYQLARTMFQQPLAAWTSGCARQTVNTTKCVLYSDPNTGASITTGAQISNAITYATSLGLSVSAGTTPAFISVPFETVRDLTLSDVIRRCLQWTPDAVSWCDYSSGSVTVLNFQQRALLSSASLSLTAVPAIIESFSIRKRNDLVPTGVRFNYLTVKTCAIAASDLPAGCDAPPTGSTQQVVTLTQDDSGAVTTAGALVGTVDMAQLTEGTTEPVPVGLAGEYYTSLLTPPWDGSITTRERECAGTIRPGVVLNVTGGETGWATMNALVQQVTEILTTGETAITIGPPSHLMPQDFVTLIQLTRRRAFLQNAFAATRAPGTVGVPNCYAGIDPDAQKNLNNIKGNAAQAAQNMNKGSTGTQNNIGGNLPTKDLSACVSGVVTTVTVYGPA